MGIHVVEKNSKTGNWIASFGSEENLNKAAITADFYLQLVDGPWENNHTRKVEYG